MGRRIFEFFSFFITGVLLVAALTWWKPDKNAPRLLVDTRSSIPVFVTDTAALYDTCQHRIGKLYPDAVVYMVRPFVIDSGRIRIKMYGWIYYENIFNLGKEWLVIHDENIRVKNNLAKIGRISKNTRFSRGFSPNNWEWNFVSLDCYVKIRSLRSLVYSRYQPIFSHRWPYAITTDLTTDGSKYPTGRYKLMDIHLPGFFAMFLFVGMIMFLWFYFRKTGRLHCRDRWVLFMIDVVGFTAGVIVAIVL